MSVRPIEEEGAGHARGWVVRRLTARDVMTSRVVTVRPDTPIPEVARLLTEHRISGAPVVDEQGRLVGIVTERDLLFKEAGPGGLPKLAPYVPARSAEVGEQVRRYEGKVAADVMTRDVVTAEEQTPVRVLAATMARRDVNRIPIVREGRVVGIVSRNDVLKVFLRPDTELTAAVAEAILTDTGIDPQSLEIYVRDGVITVRGRVERRSQAEWIRRCAQAIDGVVDVDVSGVAYVHDDRSFAVRRVAGVDPLSRGG
ncbi:MAG: CBS domain-containing protein [Armatimonadota bacterium]|nr:CBS domain-containing protein [Armatimonadota bacterium]MDR5697554.1 CBS domain-containing protein [Armatimonadota bacterium]